MWKIPLSIPTICNKPHVDILKNAPLRACWKRTGHWIETPCTLWAYTIYIHNIFCHDMHFAMICILSWCALCHDMHFVMIYTLSCWMLWHYNLFISITYFMNCDIKPRLFLLHQFAYNWWVCQECQPNTIRFNNSQASDLRIDIMQAYWNKWHWRK